MKKYIMNSEEFEALDKVLWKSGLSKHGGLDVVQVGDADCFEDLEEGGIITFEEGLQLIYESGANDICFENQDISEEEHEIVNQLFKKFGIGE